MPQISIIIPIYNAEQYLRKCLDSIINQTFKDIEVICVNDGSTDNSLAILREYAAKDNRIKVISQENQGVSAARNSGIDNANGEYILFCDPDDSYKPYACAVIASEIEKNPNDVIAFGHENYIDGELDEVDFYLITEIKKKNKFNDWLYLQVYVWEKAFKRSFIEKHNIRFPVGIKNAEDLVFCLLTYFSGAQYSLLESALYEYNKERNGESTFTNPKGIENDTAAYKYLVQTDIFKNLSLKKQCAVTNFFIGGSITYFKNFKDSEYCEEVTNNLKSLLTLVQSKYTLIRCLMMKNFWNIQKALIKEKYKKFFKYFNIITTKREKRFIIFGFTFIVKRKPKKCYEVTKNYKNCELIEKSICGKNRT